MRTQRVVSGWERFAELRLPPHPEHTLTDGSPSWGLGLWKGPLPRPGRRAPRRPAQGLHRRPRTVPAHGDHRSTVRGRPASTGWAPTRPESRNGASHDAVPGTLPSVSSVCSIFQPGPPRPSPDRSCSESRPGCAGGGGVHGHPSRPRVPKEGVGGCARTARSDKGVVGSPSASARWPGPCSDKHVEERGRPRAPWRPRARPQWEAAPETPPPGGLPAPPPQSLPLHATASARLPGGDAECPYCWQTLSGFWRSGLPTTKGEDTEPLLRKRQTCTHFKYIFRDLCSSLKPKQDPRTETWPHPR